MSGHPYPAGVDRIVELLEAQAALSNEIDALRPKAERFKLATQEYVRVSSEVVKLLDTMDLDSTGNAGFGGRMGWFLAEMRKRLLGERASG